MLSSQRLLIVEEEFLIALDIQRVVEGANATQTIIARSFDELALLEDCFETFDLAIVTPPRQAMGGDWLVADKLARAGVALVICSAASHIDVAGTSLAHAQMVQKPFSDDELLDACKRALAARKPV